MGVKAPDVKFVLAPQGPLLAPKAQAPRGVWGHALQESFKIEHTETPFPAFLRQGWNSLKFSLKSKILNENGSKSKTPKYWYQSTGRYVRPPASNENPAVTLQEAQKDTNLYSVHRVIQCDVTKVQVSR